MLFHLFSFSLCQYTIDFTQNIDITNGKYVGLILEPFDRVEIRVNKSIWTLLSEWYYGEKITLNVYANSIQNKYVEFGPIKSSSKLIAIHFKETNYSMKFSNDSGNEQLIGVIVMPPFYDITTTSYGPYSFPFLERYNNINDLINIPENYFYYDVDSKKHKYAYYLFFALFVIYVIFLTITDGKYVRISIWSLCCNKNRNDYFFCLFVCLFENQSDFLWSANISKSEFLYFKKSIILKL